MTIQSTNNSFEFASTPPSIPSFTKVLNSSQRPSNFPVLTMRNGHLRPVRHPPHHSNIAQQSQHQQAITLPSLASSSSH